MKTTITFPGVNHNQNAVTTELPNIMVQLGIEPRKELARPFASWDEMERWNHERLQHKRPLTEALEQFRNTLNQNTSQLQGIGDRYQYELSQIKLDHTNKLTNGLGIIAGGSTVLTLLLWAVDFI
jgi:hypothetical protein